MNYIYNNESHRLQRLADADDIADSIRFTLNYYKQKTEKALQIAQKTKEQIKIEVQNEYLNEIHHLKEENSFSWGTFSSKQEVKNWQKFCNDHAKCRTESKWANSAVPYVIPHQTGLGQIVEAVCPCCNTIKDITDIEGW